MKTFRKAGFLSLPFLIQYPSPGNSIHYAGSVPMNQNQLKYSVNKDCVLNKSRNVYLIDGSSLPVLPAKNLTFFLMANALRVARKIKAKI